jgi:hypothetical protein
LLASWLSFTLFGPQADRKSVVEKKQAIEDEISIVKIQSLARGRVT